MPWSLRTYIARTTSVNVDTKVERVDADRIRIKTVKLDGTTASSVVGTNAQAALLQKELAALLAPPPVSQPTLYWGARMDGEVYGRGDAPWDQVTWDTFEAHAGRKVSLVNFGQPAPWNQAFAPSPLNACYARGAVPLLDMQIGTDTLANIVSGARDAAITTWAQAVKTYGRPFLYRWCHEMNGTWYGYGKEAAADPTLYVKAWRRWRDLCNAAGATNITWVWCPNVIFPGSTSLQSLYPGDGYVDWLGMDGYNFNTPWVSPTQVFGATYTALQTLSSKPIVICETGCTEAGGSKAAWIKELLAVIPVNYPQIKALSWFNWNIVEGGVRKDWQIESSAAAQGAFASGIASPRYASNNYAGLTGLVKIDPV